MKKLIIIGAGGHGRDVAWLAADTGQHVIEGYIDDGLEIGSVVNGLPVLGPIGEIKNHPDAEFIIAIGAPRQRKAALENMQSIFDDGQEIAFATLLHPSAIIAKNTVIKHGTIICANSIIAANAEIGAHSIVNIACTVGHDVVMHGFNTLGPQVALSGTVSLEEGVELGTGSRIRQNLNFGEGSMAAMGAVVMKDVVENSMVLGNPARPISKLSPF